jgi:hypothetical protein
LKCLRSNSAKETAKRFRGFSQRVMAWMAICSILRIIDAVPLAHVASTVSSCITRPQGTVERIIEPPSFQSSSPRTTEPSLSTIIPGTVDTVRVLKVVEGQIMAWRWDDKNCVPRIGTYTTLRPSCLYVIGYGRECLTIRMDIGCPFKWLVPADTIELGRNRP